MKISWKCLNQIIDLKNITVSEAANKLNLAGFEVEKIIRVETIEDTILDINITANRQDIIGFIHIAVELSALFKTGLITNNSSKLIEDNTSIASLKSLNNMQIFKNLNICIIKNISTSLTNKQITDQLLALDIKTTNSFLDIIHFINLKWGQNIHVYKLTHKNTNNINNYIFTLKNHKNQELQIYINNEVLVEITLENILNSHTTSNILLINYTLVKHDKNQFISKYSDFNYHLNAYQELFNILKSLSHNIIDTQIIYKYNNTSDNKQRIICNIDNIYKILGPIDNKQTLKKINENTITDILDYLNFKIEKHNKKLYIKVPENRQSDIHNYVDIIEEVGRIYGFNYFKDITPKFGLRTQYTMSCSIKFKRKIRRILRSMGIHEVIHYSFQQNSKSLGIINPLNNEQKNLKNNLISKLVSSKIHNTNQGNKDFEVFEIGTVFIKEISNNKYHETIHLSCLLGKLNFNPSTWQQEGYSLSWLQAKGQIEEFFEKLHAKVSWSTQNYENTWITSLIPYIHPTKNIYITHKNETIGLMSQLNNRISKKISLLHDIYIFEISVHKLEATIQSYHHLTYKYLPYSNYPKVTRDFSITISSQVSMQHINNIINQIKNTTNHMVESITLLNEYHNNKTTRTICLRISYRSEHETLTSAKVKILDKIFKTKILLAVKSKT